MMDIMGFFWNMGLVAVSSIILLLKYSFQEQKFPYQRLQENNKIEQLELQEIVGSSKIGDAHIDLSSVKSSRMNLESGSHEYSQLNSPFSN